MKTVTDFIFGSSKITADGDCSHESKRRLLLGRKAMTNLDSILNSRHYFANKGPSSQDYGFSSSHVWMWELDHKESWVQKNWCFWTVVLEKTLESLLDCKEVKPVNHKGNQPWIFIRRTDSEAPILWPPDAKSWLIWKDLDGGKDWGQEEKGTIEDKMVGWHHWLNGCESDELWELVVDRKAWCAVIHGVAKSRIWLSDFTFTFMCRYESWTIKKAECWRIDAFEMWFGEDSWESLGLQEDPSSQS